MNRLITFGCSHTEGSSLPQSNEQVWGKIVSKHLGLEFVNEGIYRSSNKLIAHQIRNFNFLPTDTVVVLWSYTLRHTKLESKYSFEHFTPNNEKRINKTYYKYFYSDYDSEFTSKVYINYILHYLLSSGIKFYFAGITHDTLNNLTDINDYNLPIDFEYYQTRYKISTLDKHLGVLGNVIYGNDMTEKILHKGYTPFVDFKPFPVNLL